MGLWSIMFEEYQVNFAVRRRALFAAPVAVALGLAGCSIHEQTQIWYEPANGVSADVGDIALRNVLVVADDSGQATVVASISNSGEDDELVEVVVGDATAQPSAGAIDIPSRGYATVGPDAERIDVPDTEAEPGHTIEVEFRFARAPRATMDALVQAADGLFADALPDETAAPATEETPGTEETPAADG